MKKKQVARRDKYAINIGEFINDMSEAELRALNELIVKRLNILQHQRTMQSMADFRPGDVVSFQTDKGEIITGVLVRLNKKSVTVLTKNDNRWNVAPQLLTLVKRTLVTEELENILEKTLGKALH